MLPPVLTSAPATSPVTLADMKAHGIVDFADDDGLLQGLLDAAVAHLDGYSGVLGRCLISQDWRQDFEEWDARMYLPFPNCSELTITYYDENETEQTVSSSLYEVLEGVSGTYVSFKEDFTEPTLDGDRDYPVSISFTAGYGAASDVPKPIRRAVMFLVSHMYENRSGNGEIPSWFDAMIAPFRRVGT